MDNELKDLTDIVCHNKAQGCSWQGHYESYRVNHRTGAHGDNNVRSSLQTHLPLCTYEDLQCRDCSMTFTHRLLYEQHARLCPKAIVPCPLSRFGCETQVGLRVDQHCDP